MAQFHPDAADKLIESARFYEQQASGLGERFLKAVETAVGQASAHPELYPVIHADAVRRCLVSWMIENLFKRRHGVSRRDAGLKALFPASKTGNDVGEHQGKFGQGILNSGHWFPFSPMPLFEALPEDIVALAVMHQHRRPGYWADRLAAPHHQPNHHGGAA